MAADLNGMADYSLWQATIHRTEDRIVPRIFHNGRDIQRALRLNDQVRRRFIYCEEFFMGKKTAGETVQSRYVNALLVFPSMRGIGNGEWRDDTPIHRNSSKSHRYSFRRAVGDGCRVGDEFPWLLSMGLLEPHPGSNLNSRISQPEHFIAGQWVFYTRRDGS